jgi:hypothetical protein
MADFIRSHWQHFYPCEDCGFGSCQDDAFRTGDCYKPCPKCGGNRVKRVGRLLSVRRTGLRRLLGGLRVVDVEWKARRQSQDGGGQSQ